MTIERAHEILSNGLVNAPSEHEWCEAFKTAIDTMRKYQKIVEIVKAWDDMNSFDSMLKISEVLEDRNED
jgi:hypothetical protein